MSGGIELNYEYAGAHIKDYIENNSLFDTFEVNDIKTIMKYAKLTSDDFNTLLNQSRSHAKARELFICTRKANISINNL